MVLRAGKTPGGVEVRAHLRRLVRRIRTRWKATRITIRGDSHYARPEAMAFCEANGIRYVFGLAGSRPLSAKVEEVADRIRTERALEDAGVVRGFTETRHRAGSWTRERRAVARIKATRLGLDIRFVVTNIDYGSAEWIYDSLYCARGQAENLIKLHKTQLASDRTSCRSATANQMRLVLHTAAYRLMLAVRDATPPDPRSGARRICHLAPAAPEGGRPGRRNRQPRAARLSKLMPRGRPHPQPRIGPKPRRSLTDGAIGSTRQIGSTP